MNILFLDTETTGLDSEENAVIQIAAEYHENGTLVKSFNKKFFSQNGEKRINLGALKVNKTSLSALHSAPSETVAVEEFVDFLLSLNPKEQVFLCCENVVFDLGFIKELLKKYSIEGLDAIISYRVLDTATISLFLKEAGVLKVEKLGLTNVAKALNLEEPSKVGFHDASYDTKIMAKVYYRLLELTKDLNIVVNSR